MVDEKPAIRNSSGKFKKGVSGNPNGRPKIPQEFKDIVKANTVKAINTLVNIMDDASAKEADRIKAAEIVIDRAYGKAAQPIMGDKEKARYKANRDLILARRRELYAINPSIQFYNRQKRHKRKTLERIQHTLKTGKPLRN